MPSPESRSHRTGHGCDGLHDDSGSPVAVYCMGNLSIVLTADKSNLDRDIVNCFKPVFYLEHGQPHQLPGYTQSNSMCP
jgi:hypothetical protein